MKIEATITREDVRRSMRATEHGRRNICHGCLVSTIVRRIHKNSDIFTGGSTCRVGDDRYVLTYNGKKLVDYFDTHAAKQKNVDAFYKEIKSAFPGMIALTL